MSPPSWIPARLGTALLAAAAVLPAWPAAAAGPPECALLDDPGHRRHLSGPGEVALQLRCGWIAPGPPSRRLAPAPAPPAAPGGNALVNDRTTDTFPNITQSETSVAVSGSTVLVGFNDSGQFAATGDFTGYARSTDGGATWTDAGPPATPLGDVAAVLGDPVLVADRARGPGQTAVFYFANLAEDGAGTSIVGVHRTDDGGATWAQAANASPLAAAGQFQDKAWMAVDTRASGTGAGNVYVCWRRFGGGNGIQFSRSTDGGASFTQLAGSLSASTGSVQGCVVAVDPTSGDVYVAWTDFGATPPVIRVRRSVDQGVTFGAEVTVGASPPAETTTTCGGVARTVFLDGEAGNTGRAIRSSPFPAMAVDPTSGHVYVVWHRSSLAGGALADIALSRSTDGGTTWSAAVRVNGVATGQQFFPAIAVNTAGQIQVTYYSTQNSPTDRRLDVYAALSTDGGASFGAPVRVTDVSFDRPQTNPNFDTLIAACYMGDYNGVTAAAPGLGDDRDFYLAWGDNRLDGDPGAAVRPDPDIRFQRLAVAAGAEVKGDLAVDGVPVPGRPVKLVDVATGARTSTTTDAAGVWRFSDVGPAPTRSSSRRSSSAAPPRSPARSRSTTSGRAAGQSGCGRPGWATPPTPAATSSSPASPPAPTRSSSRRSVCPDGARAPVRAGGTAGAGPAVLLALLLVASVPAGARAADPAGALPPDAPEARALSVVVRDSRLSVDARNVPWAEVVAEIARAAGIRLRVLAVPPARTGTIRFEGLAPAEALERIAGRALNLLLVYEGDAPDARLAEVWVLGQGGRGPGAAPGASARAPHPGSARARRGGPAGAADAALEARLDAIEELADQAPEIALPRLGQALADPDPAVREAAAEALGELGDARALEPLAELLAADPEPEVRAAAAEALGELGAREAVPRLGQRLVDADESVRESVVDALAQLGGREAERLVRQALQDEDEDVREAAADALRLLQRAASRPAPAATAPAPR